MNRNSIFFKYYCFRYTGRVEAPMIYNISWYAVTRQKNERIKRWKRKHES